MKGNKGITLIALVITIIVLLILAGVSIAMLSGENSILKRGNEAATNTAIATGKEKVALAVNEALTEYNAKVYGSSSQSTTITAEIAAKLGSSSGLSKEGNWGVSGTTLPTNAYTDFNNENPSVAKFAFNVSSNGKTYTATISTQGGITWAETTTTTQSGG